MAVGIAYAEMKMKFQDYNQLLIVMAGFTFVLVEEVLKNSIAGKGGCGFLIRFMEIF